MAGDPGRDPGDAAGRRSSPRCDKRIGELFDLIAGTSTRGDPRTRPDHARSGEPRPAALPGLLPRSAVHDKGTDPSPLLTGTGSSRSAGLLASKFTVKGLDATLQTYFGESRLKDAICEVVITSYDLESRDAWFIARHKARQDPRFRLPDAARRPRHLGRPYLLPPGAALAAAAGGDGRRRRLRQQPGYVRLRGGNQASRPNRHPRRLTWHGPGQDPDPLPAGAQLGPDRLGPSTDRRVHGRRPDTVEHQLSFLLPDQNGQPRYSASRPTCRPAWE